MKRTARSFFYAFTAFAVLSICVTSPSIVFAQPAEKILYNFKTFIHGLATQWGVHNGCRGQSLWLNCLGWSVRSWLCL